MLTTRPVKTIVSFLLIFALSLFASGCGSTNEEKVIGESAAQAAVSAEETADHSDSEIPDKFVMLKEVYDILSFRRTVPYSRILGRRRNRHDESRRQLPYRFKKYTEPNALSVV